MPKQLAQLLHTMSLNARDLLPIVAVTAFFQLFIVQEPMTNFAEKAVGISMVVVGLTLFLAGLSLSLFPLGERLADEFAQRGNLRLLLLFALAIGFGSTAAEPALIAVADEAAKAMSGNGAGEDSAATALALRFGTAGAVGLALVVSCLRIIHGWSPLLPVAIVYGLALALALVHPGPAAAIAFDAGAAATSAINIPLIAALGIGLATVLEGRSPLIDGFGVVALASGMPVIVVLLGFAILH